VNKVVSRLGFLARRIRNQFYLGLFVLFSLLSVGYFNFEYDLFDYETLQYDAGALDTAFGWRLKSPIADERFLIVEIDEASLAQFAKDYGRWPWPRAVFAEVLAGVSFYAPLSITFNIMFSDPDKLDPDSDLFFNSIIDEVDNVIFPATRLSKKNDAISQVPVSRLPFARDIKKDQTVAILITMFKGAHEKMGVNNLLIDDDGIVRRYSALHAEPNFAFKTMPGRIAEIESIELTNTEYLINWPESLEDYESISFKTLYKALEENEEQTLQTLSGRHVIFGLSAPGLSFQRPTPISAFTEDSRILASIADNIVQDSGLKTIPPLMVLCLSILVFGILSVSFFLKVDDGLIDSFFVAFETLSILITVGSISYTNYAIDLSFIILAGIFYFAVCKLYDGPVKSSERGHRAFFDGDEFKKSQYFSVFICQPGDIVELLSLLNVRSRADERVYFVDNFFSSQSLFQEEIVESEVVIFLHNEVLVEGVFSEKYSVKCNSTTGDTFQFETLRVIFTLYQKMLNSDQS